MKWYNSDEAMDWLDYFFLLSIVALYASLLAYGPNFFGGWLLTCQVAWACCKD